MSAIVGFIGALFILLAWVPETYRTIKSKNLEALDIRFFLLYMCGTSTLIYYSFLIKDNVFILLNSAILVVQITEFCIVFYKKYFKYQSFKSAKKHKLF